MGELVFGALAPHPPIIIESVGGKEREKAAKTVSGLEQLAHDLAAAAPESIVFVSPHGPVFEDAVMILGGETLEGSLERFGAPAVRMEHPNDLPLAERIIARAKEKGIYAAMAGPREIRRFGIDPGLDHGILVPLAYFRRAGYAGKLLAMGMAMFPPDELYDFGTVIQSAIEDGEARVAIVASGDMSHRLTPEAPAGYHRRGQEFDLAIVESLQRGDFAGIMDLDPGLVEQAGECGYRPLNILLGAFDSYNVKTKVYSYEGPFGVGYLNAGIVPVEKSGKSGELLTRFRSLRSARLAEEAGKRHPLVALAAKSLEYYLKTGRYLIESANLPSDMPERAGVFVSIKKHGQLRGCIGTISPTQESLVQEVIRNAVSAGTKDPRFLPIELEELPELSISVDVLGAEEKIQSPDQLDPERFGVIVRKGHRSGLLLPNLEGIDTVEQQLYHVRQKAGIGANEEVSLSRFEVKRYH